MKQEISLFKSLHFWLRLSLLSLLVVALLGTLMRYKIGFSFPYFNQKNIQHAHSHFAFAGWITQTLMVLMVSFLQKNLPTLKQEKYIVLLFSNLLCAYIMLVAFFLQGYAPFSIVFSTISIFIFYTFAYFFGREVGKIQHPSKAWFQASLFFGVLSSLGTFALAYMMASKNLHQHLYLASIYFYLHFQYNGWFFFACMGLWLMFLQQHKGNLSQNKPTFLLWVVSCLPAYFLSTLWAKIPIFVYVLTVLSALIQMVGLWLFLQMIHQNLPILRQHLGWVGKIVFAFILFSLAVKFSLQLGSVVPSVSQMAFGFRPIVIAYLHLVLLAIISTFLVSYVCHFYFQASKANTFFLTLFVVGVYLNELVLGLQGILAIRYTLLPYANETLFLVALIIVLGCLGLFFVTRKRCIYD